MHLRRDKEAHAVGRASWRSSFLGDAGANFLCGKRERGTKKEKSSKKERKEGLWKLPLLMGIRKERGFPQQLEKSLAKDARLFHSSHRPNNKDLSIMYCRQRSTLIRLNFGPKDGEHLRYISPGQHWDTAVEEALASCPNVLLVLSPSSVGSVIVMDEVAFALDEKKIVIPVLHRDCKIPLRLCRLQYIDARAEYKKALAELIRMLAGREQGVDATPEPARDKGRSGYNSNSAAIATGLKKITGSGFLIVSHDEIYVQFTGSGGSSGIYCEAVGEKYSKKKFTAEQAKELRTLGFEFDEKGHGN